MAAGSSVGTATMLRARRRDVNVKPNRRLDRKSSRGMLYENEELRLRTININAEVERGQNDIKKLRRENEQLRREIWGLREEYDRLEGLLNQLQGAATAENAAEGNYNPENGRSSMVENEENIQKASSCIQSQNHRNSLKVEFDGLSVVDEETDDNLTASETSEVNNNSSAVKESAPNERLNVVISPYMDAPVVTRRKDGVCCRPHDLQLLRDIHGSGMWRKSFYNGDDECGSCPKPVCRETHFPRNHLFPRVQCRSQTKISQVIECPPDKSDFLFQSGNSSRIGYAYSSLADGNRLSSYTSEGSLVGNCFVPNPIYNINSPVEEMTLSECFHVHGGPDFFISGACPVDMARPQFPVGGNLEQLLQEVHDTSCACTEMSREHHTKGSDRKDMVQEHQSKVCHGIFPQTPDSTAITTPPVEMPPTTSVVIAAITGVMPITTAASSSSSSTTTTTTTTTTAATTTTTTTTTTITAATTTAAAAAAAAMAMTAVEAGHSGETKQMAENNIISILPHFQTLKVGEGRSEDEARKDRFRSQLNIQLHIPENKVSSEDIPTIEKGNIEEVQPSNVSHSSHLQTQNHSNTKREHEDDHNNSLAPQFFETAALHQRKLYKLPFEQGYQDFIASNPEISRTKPIVQSNSMQNLNSPLQAESTDPRGATYNWRSNAYGRIQCITQQQNITPKTAEQVQTVSNILPPSCSETISKTHPQLPRHEIELPASTEECIFQQNNIAQPADNRSCIALDNPHHQMRNNYVRMPSNSYEPPASDHHKEPGSIPPSPASSQRASSVVHLRGDHHVEDAERLRKSLFGSEGDNARRGTSIYPHRKMSVIVGDTQQGCFSVDNSHSSPGHDSSTKLDRRRQVSGTINHKRRYGIASRPDFGVASSGSNNLTRSVSLDPTKQHFPVSSPETSILGGEPVSQERNNSVSSRPGSAMGTPNSMKVKISQGNIGRVSTSNQNKSVPWCACWGNGCL